MTKQWTSMIIPLIAAWMLVVTPLMPSKAQEQILTSENRAQLSQHLEYIAEALSTLLTAREFRSFMAIQLGASPQRNTIALSDFIAAAISQGPEINAERLFALTGRVQDVESMMRTAGMSVPRLDLELPAGYREALQASERMQVAVGPLVDENEVESVMAFSDGERITLSADAPPDVPTIVIKLAEMESLEPTYPLPTLEQPQEEKQGRIVDDFVGIPQIMITSDHEPWYWGSPEIVIRYRRFKTTGVFQDLKRDLPSVNDEDRLYSLGDPNDTYLFFDNSWDADYETIVWEDDGPGSNDVVGVFIINWRSIPFGNYDGPRSKGDAQIHLDRD